MCARVLLLLLCLLLCALSTSYAIGQLLDVTLKIVTECEPKTNEEIWEHSYQSSLRNGEVVIDAESQFGETEESCWTTNNYQIDTSKLWDSNHYEWEWRSGISAECICFGVIALYSFIIIMYGAITIVRDLTFIARGTLHETAKGYPEYMKALKSNGCSLQTPPQRHSGKQIGVRIRKCIESAISVYRHYFSADTAGWILRKLLSDLSEFVVVSLALLKANGYDVFDSENNPLAEDPNTILAFTVVLSVNMCISGILWLSYSHFTKYCYGATFEQSLLLTDSTTDLLYSLFPLYVIWSNKYNQNTTLMTLLGQLNLSGIAFWAAVFPLCLLSNRCLVITMKTRKKMKDDAFNEWKAHNALKHHSTTNVAVRVAKEAGFQLNASDIYIRNRKLSIGIQPLQQDTNWINQNPSNRRIKQCFLSLVALLFVVYGVLLLSFVTAYMEAAVDHCASATESVLLQDGSLSIGSESTRTLKTNPELFVWDQCRFKVYPFTFDEQYRCQCRVFVIDWDDLESSANDWEKWNLTQISILEGMLTHWTMLEKFRTTSLDQNEYELFNFTPNMFDSVHMKAFEWEYVQNESIPSEISQWKQLEHLRFGDVDDLTILPDELGQLSNLKSLSFQDFQMSPFPLFICNLTNLETLQMYDETQGILYIPHCIENLQQMRVMLLDAIVHLEDIPLSIFSLPNLRVLSLSWTEMTYGSILEYNLPFNISPNDTEAVDEWMESNFKYLDPNNTEYWISRSSICDENTTLFPASFGEFVDMACEYPLPATNWTALYDDTKTSMCPPWALGNGHCDTVCQTADFLIDLGTLLPLLYACD